MQTAFIELQMRWYAALTQEGFEDIEDVTREDRPLLKWTGLNHNHVVESERASFPSWPETPFVANEELLYHPKLSEVCDSICKHGNNSLTHCQVKKILYMHIHGLTCREIGRSLDIGYVTVFRTQKKLNEWALLIENRED